MHISLSYFENNIYIWGNFESSKVFAKVKNGQKKCPIFKRARIFVKQDFPEMHFTPKCSTFQKL
jgi:hypothetical protein